VQKFPIIFGLLSKTRYLTLFEGKSVPQHTYGGAGGRGGIAPTHSRPRHQMGVSGQRHAPAALYPREKDHRYTLYRRLGGPQSRSGYGGWRKKSLASVGSNFDWPVIHSVARHYTD
jgi:hypothetical protein